MAKIRPKRILVRSILLLTVFYAVFLSLKLIMSRPFFQRLDISLKHRYNEIYFNFLASRFDLDLNKRFIKSVEEITAKEASITPALWKLRVKKLPLDVEVPSYYRTGSKPIVQPFDPRLTIGVYYQYLQHYHNKEDGTVPFHWIDWVDLSRIYPYITNPKKENLCETTFNLTSQPDLIKDSRLKNVDSYCSYDPDSLLGYTIFSNTGPHTIENRAILGKSYLFNHAPSPQKLVFLTTTGSYQIGVESPEENDFYSSLLYNEMMEKLNFPTNINIVHNFQALLSTKIKQYSSPLEDQLLEIPPENFDIDPSAKIDELWDHPDISEIEANYLDSIQFSFETKDPPKFFYEASLLRSIPDDWQGEHYDWRFFSELTVNKPEQSVVLHRLVKNWLAFARNHGIVTWIAHGSLLSWYWNGIAFPWDTDVDVQMPISELYKIGRYYNQSLIIENAADAHGEFDGVGRYFLDVGSSITNRTKGNGNNAIDARFIDVDTGLFIDITALALTNEKVPSRYNQHYQHLSPATNVELPPSSSKDTLDQLTINNQLQLYNCRNNHFTSHEEISPLIRTIVENQVSYVPQRFLTILNVEYNLESLTKKNHRAFTYFSNLRLWYHTKAVKRYLNARKKDPKEELTYRELMATNQLSVEDHINLIKLDPLLLQEWTQTRNFTKLHVQEMQFIQRGDFEKLGKFQQEYIDQVGVGKALRSDYFMDLLMNDEEMRESIEERAQLYFPW
ncbi:uncharacterized protein LODBEIA_P44270 [Lodderomyces beijingensis]|uniref:LicD/FKTN/FKRP nucleotidyltransferase domain-containing protein n=1 Tax=Lodderomyces beijingensis TaxID=1775926 RepID=A0ABP0ZR89_9ASCO